MEKKLKKKLELVEKKLNMFMLLICILIICIFIKFCCNNLNFFIDIFKNPNGDVDNSIIWSAISAIGTLIAFIGVIITIIYTEKSRIKQNQYEYRKENLLMKQKEFEEYSRSLEKIFDPIKIADEIIKFDGNNNIEINQIILTYISNLYNIEFSFNWFFDNEISCDGVHIELLKEINNYREEIKNIVNEINTTIKEFYLKKVKILEQCIESGNCKKGDDEINKELFCVREKLSNISKKIMDFRNLHLPILNNLLRNGVLERENKVYEILNYRK